MRLFLYQKLPFSRLSICSLVNEVRLRWSLRFNRRRAWSSSDGVVVVGVGGADREFSPELTPPSSEISSPPTRRKQSNETLPSDFTKSFSFFVGDEKRKRNKTTEIIYFFYRNSVVTHHKFALRKKNRYCLCL